MGNECRGMSCRHYDPMSTSSPYCETVCLKNKEPIINKMKTMTIKIYSIPEVSTLVAKAIKVENNDITITQGRYVIDGKSLMGVFSLDLTREIIVEYPETAFEFEDFIRKFKAE